MLKKLTHHGNSLALVIEKPILQLLNITLETTLSISTDGKKIIVSPLGKRAARAKQKAEKEGVKS